MPNGISRPRPAVLSLEGTVPQGADLKQPLAVDVPTDLLLACAWAAVGLAVSVSMAVAFPLADPLATLLALG